MTRQGGREVGEFAGLAVDLDRAAMLLRDDVPADREPEPRPFAGRLGREERLKEPVPDFGRDAGAVVAHLRSAATTAAIAPCRARGRTTRRAPSRRRHAGMLT